jgi:hypothetical protein
LPLEYDFETFTSLGEATHYKARSNHRWCPGRSPGVRLHRRRRNHAAPTAQHLARDEKDQFVPEPVVASIGLDESGSPSSGQDPQEPRTPTYPLARLGEPTF